MSYFSTPYSEDSSAFEIDIHEVSSGLEAEMPTSSDRNETLSWETSSPLYYARPNASVTVSVTVDHHSLAALRRPASEDTAPLSPSSKQSSLLINDTISNSTSGEPSWNVFQSPPMLGLLIVFVVFSIVVLFWHPLRRWWISYNLRLANDPDSSLSHLPIPPGDFGLPIIGETFSWISQGSKFNSTRRQKYGNIFTSHAIGLPMIRVTGHEFVKEILKGEHDNVTTIWPKNVRLMLGENVLANSTGAIHRLKRRIVSKAFSRSALDSYVPLVRQQAIKSVKAFNDCETPRMYEKILKMTFDIAAKALLGIDSETTGAQNFVGDFYTFVNNIMSVPIEAPGFGFWKGMRARKQLLHQMEDHIRKLKEQLKKEFRDEEGDGSGEKIKPAFEIILREIATQYNRSAKQNGNNNNIGENETEYSLDVNDLELKEMAMEMMFAGYFTSASALTSCVYHLERNPEVFQKIEDELLEHGFLREQDSRNDEEAHLDLHAIHNLTYLEQVFKETLRVSPPVLGGYRQARKTFQIGNYKVPKGWTVIYNIRDTHEFEYENMNEFDPDRFERGNQPRENYKFIPFGGGPRMCVGREFARLAIKTALIEIFRHYRKWEIAGVRTPKMRAIPTLHPVNGLPCKLYPRESVGILIR